MNAMLAFMSFAYVARPPGQVRCLVSAHWRVKTEIEKCAGLEVEVKDGVPHDYLNMNKDGDSTSSEVVEFLVGDAEKKLNELQ